MVQQYAMVVDSTSCVGCHACEVACKQENGLPAGPNWISVHEDDSLGTGDNPLVSYLVTHCMHCHHPRCVEACPEDAITKREDGVVLIDSERCSGCLACVEACPFGVIQFDEERGVAQKCTLCVERLEEGRQPACVTACLSQCIYVGSPSEIVEKLGQSRARLWYGNIV